MVTIGVEASAPAPPPPSGPVVVTGQVTTTVSTLVVDTKVVEGPEDVTATAGVMKLDAVVTVTIKGEDTTTTDAAEVDAGEATTKIG
jgi:hypothetical protein